MSLNGYKSLNVFIEQWKILPAILSQSLEGGEASGELSMDFTLFKQWLEIFLVPKSEKKEKRTEMSPNSMILMAYIHGNLLKKSYWLWLFCYPPSVGSVASWDQLQISVFVCGGSNMRGWKAAALRHSGKQKSYMNICKRSNSNKFIDAVLTCSCILFFPLSNISLAYMFLTVCCSLSLPVKQDINILVPEKRTCARP